MKNIKDLTTSECITAPTMEIFMKLLRLNNDTKLTESDWDASQDNVYFPKRNLCTRDICAEMANHAIHPYTDFIEETQAWQPKSGEWIWVSDDETKKFQKRMFTHMRGNFFVCVNDGHETDYLTDKPFKSTQYKFATHCVELTEITLEQLAEKGFKIKEK